MWDLIVSVPDHCLSFYFSTVGLHFCCTCVSVLVLLLSTLSVESCFVCYFFDSLMREVLHANRATYMFLKHNRI